MKNSRWLLLFSLCTIFLLSSCALGTATYSTGLPDQGYIELRSNNQHRKVIVEIDDEASFVAKVNHVRRRRSRSIKFRRYPVPTGRHIIAVYTKRGGRRLFRRKMVISPQETKVIKIR